MNEQDMLGDGTVSLRPLVQPDGTPLGGWLLLDLTDSKIGSQAVRWLLREPRNNFAAHAHPHDGLLVLLRDYGDRSDRHTRVRQALGGNVQVKEYLEPVTTGRLLVLTVRPWGGSEYEFRLPDESYASWAEAAMTAEHLHPIRLEDEPLAVVVTGGVMDVRDRISRALSLRETHPIVVVDLPPSYIERGPIVAERTQMAVGMYPSTGRTYWLRTGGLGVPASHVAAALCRSGTLIASVRNDMPGFVAVSLVYPGSRTDLEVIRAIEDRVEPLLRNLTGAAVRIYTLALLLGIEEESSRAFVWHAGDNEFGLALHDARIPVHKVVARLELVPDIGVAVCEDDEDVLFIELRRPTVKGIPARTRQLIDRISGALVELHGGDPVNFAAVRMTPSPVPPRHTPKALTAGPSGSPIGALAGVVAVVAIPLILRAVVRVFGRRRRAG